MASPTVLAGQDLTAGLLGVPAWSPATLANSWVNAGGGVVTAQYRLWALTNEYEVIGRVKNGTITDGTTVFTLPTTPASSQDVCPLQISITSGGAGGKTPLLFCTTGGALQVFYVPTGTTQLGFHGWVSLDA